MSSDSQNHPERNILTPNSFQTLKPVEQVLKDAKVKKNEINDIVLVGGSTRIPKYVLSEPNLGTSYSKQAMLTTLKGYNLCWRNSLGSHSAKA